MTKKKTPYKCPFCDKEFTTKWRVTNHIRQSRTEYHGKMGELPEGFNPKDYTYNKIGSKIRNPNISEPEKIEKVDPENMKVELINPPIKSATEILLCPDCNTPKTEWININQVDEATAEEKRVYDYMCPKCKELIRLDE